MGNRKWSWAGIIVLIVAMLFALPGSVQGGFSPTAPGGITQLFQCDPDTDPECNLPEEDDNNDQPCDPATEPECNLPEEEEPAEEPGEVEGERNTVGDRDNDGVLDPSDTCPDTFGEKPDGCPLQDDNPTQGVEASTILAIQAQPGRNGALTSTAELQFRCLVISEVLWAGTGFSRNHQYIELFNNCEETVPLTGAALNVIDTQTEPNAVVKTIALQGEIAALGFYLIVNNNLAVSNVRVDLLAAFTLADSNAALVLIGDEDIDISSANAGADQGWYAGERQFNNITLSMERNVLDPSVPDGPDNWHSNDQEHRNGLDAVGDPINGTPRAPNSPAPEDD